MDNIKEKLPTLTDREKAFAATNEPSLSQSSFKLGDREFKVVFLKYNAQLAFMAHLQPLIQMMATRLTGNEVTVPDINLGSDGFSVSTILKYCLNDLPEMVAIICRQTDETVTAAWVVDVAESPFDLIAIIMRQIDTNKMVEKIARFFVSMRPLLMPLMKQLKTQLSA